jgi:hypothetical protein
MFDPEDYELLEVVNPILSGAKPHHLIRRLFDPYLHPRGIKELAAPKSLRLAAAVFDLLNALERGRCEHRLRTLRAVRDEVLHNGSPTLRRNTARVLLQTMKELVRAHGDEHRQLELAHDFKHATTGKPRLIRRLLRKYHLLEMPEAWNQMAFDHHVHDANSKGRKTPTHLIMDAWIKGIRHLGVNYYNYVTAEAASELLEAAEIMQVHLRIGVEMSAVFHGRHVQLVWAPRGFHSRQDFIAFLVEPGTRAFMDQGHAVAEVERQHLLRLLGSFNERHLPAINAEYGLAVPPPTEEAFLDLVGAAQASQLHLAELIHGTLLPHLRRRAEELRGEAAGAGDERQRQIRALIAAMDHLVPETIAERYLRAEVNPELPDPRSLDGPEVPELLKQNVRQLVEKFEHAPRGNRTILNPSKLTVADVLEVLYEGEGRISHIEIFNLKDWAEGQTEHRERICRLRQVINDGNVIEAKRMMLDILRAVEQRDPERADRLRRIVRDIPRLQSFYRHSHLKCRLGSDSTGRSRHSQGMGLVSVPTLTGRARRQARREHRMLPVRTLACRQVTFTPRSSPSPIINRLYQIARRNRLRRIGYCRTEEWIPEDRTTTLARDGNIAALGGVPEETHNNLTLDPPAPSSTARPQRFAPRYLNTSFKNLLKVTIGFIPAFLTFFLTKDWWLLAYLGAPIWFAITGLRNIGQSVIGGGGLFRSQLLKWNDFVSWGRVADSLLFTGFSVPLLDYLIKTRLLEGVFGITTETNPVVLYTVMALANGLYISGHSTFRGLQRAAIAGNFFRTVLSIPLAIGLNALLLKIAIASGVTHETAQHGLQLWAAVISKAASDSVASIIEGLADRSQNQAMRAADFRDKQIHLLEVYGQLEVLFPEEKVLDLLEQPKQFVAAVRAEGEDLVRQVIVNALDMMYFWMYQPRGRKVFRRLIRQATEEERQILIRSQRVLERKKMVSQLFIDGLVGKQFDQALAFYLSRVDAYLRDLRRIG